ncbi:28585_t:CDS:2 [Gigaspora margarita]|uniref:28585_t:CDS:1 n=1 Tax=Gigaspora margarita TaxID=4874 RepID=A0ABM8VZC2_GIGMA|nr:28585_t:CDS:2 [Gigaspora margarita]
MEELCEGGKENENVKKKHHNLFYGLKYATFGILVVLFLLYFIYLIYKIINDIPIKSTGYVIVDELNVPDMEICSNSNDNLRDFKWKNNTINKFNNCSDYIIPGDIYLEFNPLLNNDQVISDMDRAVNSSLMRQWNFIAGMVYYSAVVKFTTTAYKTILPGDYPKEIPNGTNGYFSVAAGNFIQEQTIEQRSYTVFSALASVGGISGILLGVYAFLFGQSINPYGHVHHLCKMVPEIHSGDEQNEHKIF